MSRRAKRHDEEVLPLIDINNDELQSQAEHQEPRLVSLLIKHKRLLEECVKRGVTPECFRVSEQKTLYSMLAKYYDSYNATMTRASFADEAAKTWPDTMEASKWQNTFDMTYQYQAAEGDFRLLLEDLEGRYLQAQAYTAIQHFFDPILKKTSGQKELIEKFQRAVSRIKNHNDKAFTKSSTLAEIMQEEVWPELLARRENPESFKGLFSGFKCMDSVFHGFNRGKYMVVLAIEGGGKTTFMLNMCHNMVKSGFNAAYVTIESDPSTTSKRLLTIRTKVNYDRFTIGGKTEHGLSDYIMSELEIAKKDFEGDFGNRIHWIEALQGTPQNMIIDELDKKLAFTKLDVIFIDYLDVVGPNVKYPDRPDLELADVSACFQNYGKMHNILIVTAQQMKSDKVRELTGKGNNRKNKVSGDNFTIGVGDVSGTKKISGAADYIFGLFMDPASPGRMYVMTAKARNNRSLDRFSLSYDRESGRLEDTVQDPTGFEAIADTMESDEKFQKAAFCPAEGEQSGTAPSVQSAVSYITQDVDHSQMGLEDISDADFWSGQ